MYIPIIRFSIETNDDDNLSEKFKKSINGTFPSSSFKSSNIFPFIFLLLITLPSCGKKGPEIVPVSGTVKYQDKPIADLILNF